MLASIPGSATLPAEGRWHRAAYASCDSVAHRAGKALLTSWAPFESTWHRGDWMGDSEHNAERYRRLAADARADAQRITIPQARQILLDVAYSYERLADTLDANARRAQR